MKVATVISRELVWDVSGAKRAAKSGPEFITNRGTPAHVLLNIEDNGRLAGKNRSLNETLSMPGLSDFDLKTSRYEIESRLPDLY